MQGGYRADLEERRAKAHSRLNWAMTAIAGTALGLALIAGYGTWRYFLGDLPTIASADGADCRIARSPIWSPRPD